MNARRITDEKLQRTLQTARLFILAARHYRDRPKRHAEILTHAAEQRRYATRRARLRAMQVQPKASQS